ncbi:MAG: amidohydrolase [Spirochaetales bacterium]|nr:amidohydrolase [Spirochaetales bacterium]
MADGGGTILDCLRAGRALRHIPVIDFHTHLGASSRYYYVPFSGAQEVVRYMDRYGVDHAVTFALSTTTDPEVKNLSVYRTCRRFPRRFTPLTTLHALFPQDWEELLKQGIGFGSRGIKLLSNYQGVEELSMDWSPAFDAVRDRGWVVLHHDWRSAEHLEQVARNFPGLTFIIGHPTLDIVGSRILDRLDNVYQCTCAAFVHPGFARLSVEEMYRKLPLEKILHGSDALDLDFGTAIGPLAYAAIPEQAKEKILGGNALTLMKKIGWEIPGVGEA